MTPDDVLDRVRAGGIETIRVVFTDPHGILRGKTITAAALPGALSGGLRVPSTLLLKDVAHRTVFPVWAADGAPMRGASDVLLRPDPASFRVLPWSPHSALIHCDVSLPDGAPVAFSSREILRHALRGLDALGLGAVFGLEVEFQIYRVLDPRLAPRDATMPGTPPEVANTSQGYQYLTETRYDAVEPLLDEIRRAAQAMGMDIRSVEIEMGPSQYEVTFAPGTPAEVAETAVNFRMLAREVCARQGCLASFMPKPALPNAVANGWHIHQSLRDGTGRNLFMPEAPGLSVTAGHWVAGLLAGARAACLMTNPTVTSYKRFSTHQLAPSRIGWGIDNRGAMLRAITAPGDAASRIENRLPDSAANPYLALAAQILCGLSGLREGRDPPEALADPYAPDTGAPDAGAALPAALGEAIAAFAAAPILPPDVADWLVTLKRAEWARYLAHVSDWEQAEYFATL